MYTICPWWCVRSVTDMIAARASGTSPKGSVTLSISKPKSGLAKFSVKLVGGFAAQLLDEGFVNETVKGVRTVCVHGDNPHAVAYVRELRAVLLRQGITLQAFA